MICRVQTWVAAVMDEVVSRQGVAVPKHVDIERRSRGVREKATRVNEVI